MISGELDFDAQLVINNDYKINIEFVSENDYMDWIDPDATGGSTATVYNTQKAAKKLKDLYKNAAVFYDPLDSGIPTKLKYATNT